MRIHPKVLYEHRVKKGLSQLEVAKYVGIAQRTYSSYEKGEMKPKQDKIPKLLEILEIKKWETADYPGANMIPLFDDIGSPGRTVSPKGAQEGYYPSEFIDAGDLFPGATAAIRHYNTSMVEYPPGCILALQEIHKPFTFIWGEDYLIEYGPYRIFKRIQRSEDDQLIKAYSTNEALHTDGTMVYQPLDIPLKDIRKVYLILGHIIKKHGSGWIQS